MAMHSDSRDAIAPVRPEATSIRLSVDGAGSHTTTDNVPAGRYEVCLDKTGGICWAEWTNAAVLPAAGGSRSGFGLRDGGRIEAPGDLKLSAILTGAANTGEVLLVPVVGE